MSTNTQNPLYGKQPFAVTLAEFRAIMEPFTATDTWAQSTLIDLWTQGPPTPNSVYGTPAERRYVFPGQLYKWMADILNRKGQPLDVTANVYKTIRGNR